MSKFWQKIKNSWINSFLFSCFLMGIFLGLFLLINLDFKSFLKNNSEVEMSVNSNLEEEIKKRLGPIDISMENYSTWSIRNGLNDSNKKIEKDPDEDGLANYLEYVYGTNPLSADSDNDNYSDKNEIINGYDPDDSGDSTARPQVEISISKIGVFAPMIWSKNEKEKDMSSELENGLVHYHKTSAPGQNGNIVIFGLSSNYIWKKGNYNYIFKNLNDLVKGDEIIVTTFQKNRRVINYKYIVSEKLITMQNDGKIFENSDNSVLTLSTNWPIGTNLRRLVVKAEFAK